METFLSKFAILGIGLGLLYMNTVKFFRAVFFTELQNYFSLMFKNSANYSKLILKY